MPNIALITGASSGIGKEIARCHAKHHGDCILVARREDALKDLKAQLEKEYSVKCYVIPQDLSEPDAAETLHKKIQELQLDVDILVNNAGFGGVGEFLERNLEADVTMIQVNVVALVTLTHYIANDMVKRGKGGKILNVGSSAGFMPGPKQAVYFATKAFVNSFSQALNQELKDKNITSTVLCPGLVQTEWIKNANADKTNMTKQGGASPESVAKIGYSGMLKEKIVVFNTFMMGFMINWMIPLMPRRMLLKMGAKMMDAKE